MDLLLIGQIIALGLAALSSVSLWVEESMPINLALRLRVSALCLRRTSHKCRRALPEPNQTVAYDTSLTPTSSTHWKASPRTNASEGASPNTGRSPSGLSRLSGWVAQGCSVTQQGDTRET